MDVTVPVMQVGEMRVPVRQAFVPVAMGMRLAKKLAGFVRMLVVFVVNMRVFVFQWFVDVLVLMSFHKMQVEADGHEHGGGDQLPTDGLAEHQHG